MPKWTIALLVVCVACLVALFFGPPVLFVAREPGAIDPGDVLFTVPNPIRNRAPEKTAAAFLEELRAGRCPEIVARAACERERELRVLSWSLVNRNDHGRTSKIQYRVSRRGYRANTWGNAWLIVAGDRVTEYYAAY